MEPVLFVLTDLRDFFNHHIIFTLGVLLLTGYFFGKLAQIIRLPAITGYILAGLFLSSSLTGLVRVDMEGSLSSITEIALGVIALTIGGEFYLTKIRRIGTGVVVITVLQAVLAFLFVTAGLTVTGLGLPYASLLGAIAVATAPAATVIIVRELRARGRFIDYLYGVVALDDAVGVVIFSIVFSFVVSALGSVTGGEGMLNDSLHVARELLLSIAAGAAAGYLLHIFTYKKRAPSEILLLAVGMIFIATAVAIVLKLSLIITNMTMGAVLINLSSRNRRVFTTLEPVTPPLFALFFIIAGTELDVSVFTHVLVLFWGGVFLATRFFGKMLGVYLGAILTRSPASIRKYLGLCLFPQAGVSIGLILIVQTSPVMMNTGVSIGGIDILHVLVNIILLNVLINELIGPAVTRYGIIRAMEDEE